MRSSGGCAEGMAQSSDPDCEEGGTDDGRPMSPGLAPAGLRADGESVLSFDPWGRGSIFQ